MDNTDILYRDNWTEATIALAKSMQGPILIVGVSGFIGAALYHTLSKYRPDVYGCSRNPLHSWRLVHKQSDRIFNCDITDYYSVKQMIDHIKPMTVVNFAAYGAYSRQTDAEKIHQTNYIGALHLLRVLADSGCSAFIQTGSSSEYGTNCAAPAENAEAEPNSDYAVAKLAASGLIKYYGKTLNFPCVNLRLYSVYGPWEEKDRLIPVLIHSGLQGKYPNLVDKNISRDFVYVDDCNEAIVRATLTVCRTNPGISLNIASGKKTTLEEIANIAKKVFHIEHEPVFGSMTNRRWDLTEWYGNPQLAKRLMEWEANTPFEQGLLLNVEWEKTAAERLRNVVVPVKQKKISAILACYRDNQAIPVMYERLTAMFNQTGYDYEIIFVNDASPADDEAVISRLCATDTHVVGVSHSRNFGSQSAFVSGMDVASGDAVVLMDGDGQDPPEIISQFIAKWEDGYDIVYGKRVKREAKWYMQIFYKLFYRVFRKLSDVEVPVDAGDFSLIDKKVVSHLLRFSEKDIFLRGLRAWVGFKQTGVEYVRPERLFGKSTNNFLKNIWWAKKGIFSFSMKPLYYIQTIGVVIFILTILLGIYYLINFFVRPPGENARGIMTIIMLLLGIGSILLISISVIGDYVGKITEEVKNRPKYIRKKIILGGKIYEDEDEIETCIRKQKE
ncbi:MAG: NAD-dependent epimerase/dehydratase family protein [Bacteroidales bacterium]|jgi:nucleoside-diphosphate-sugar epimerase/glycosyltransferase involved in cell wall biosynthesis|nr:NAD-dependent epimerase/dehydratase family protein [Bacteroidales bacterium]